MILILRRTFLLFACALPVALGQDDPYAAGRATFMAARAAVAALPTEPAGGDPPELRQYPLYPYLVAARLSRQLALVVPAGPPATDNGLPLDDAIAAFLAQETDRPVTRALRRDWLASLADRRLWSQYLDVYRAERDSSPAQLCDSFAARISLGHTEDIEGAIREAWLAPKSLPAECNVAFDWWFARGGPDAALIERRARLALAAGESGLARSLVKTLPAEKSGPLLQWAALIDRPAPELSALLAASNRPVEPAALLDGWQRYARSDAQAAADDFAMLVSSRGLDAAHASPFALATALGLAWSRLPGSLEFFAKVAPADFDERAYEWHVRAALWAADWSRVAAAIAAMPDALRNQPRWRYWSGRANEQLDNKDAARADYQAVVPTDNWYAMNAAARLGEKFVPVLQPLALNDAQISLVASDPAFVRVRELRLADMGPEAATEWRAAYEQLEPAQKMQAIGLAERWGWHMQAIATAAKQGFFNDYDMLYPRPFDFDVNAAAKGTGLDAEFIYAIIRQESLYEATAGSSAGAVGLMQLLPETARRVARKAGLPTPARAQLVLPAVNVPLGSRYLADLVASFGGETALATAGYNAGPNAVRRWLPDRTMALDVWVENIPFNETRTYVQRVAWHTLVFRWLGDRKPRDVSNWSERKVRAAGEQAAAANE